MQLTAFRIFQYRNIEDSGLVHLDGPLSCVVGKNQSGKSNLLKALQKLNPHDPSVKYDVRVDWPRGRRRTRNNNQIVCEAHFDLGPVEQGELAVVAGTATPPSKVIVTKNYAGQYAASFPEAPDLFAGRDETSPAPGQAQETIIKHLPTFIYMDEHRSFDGTSQLEQLSARLDQPTPQDETLLMIFKLAGLDVNKLVEQGRSQDPETIRERQYDLQDAGKILTRAVAARWGQSPYKVQFRSDGQRFFTEIEELNKGIGMLPLEEQSKGFQWFFSFDLRFMHDSGGTFSECVLLLDEPGMHLHPGGQDDLLHRFDAYAQDNTLIYTTHLPFLVDIREPSRIHVMKEREDQSAYVSSDLASSGANERLTLQAALGMKAAQHESISHKNLLVSSSDELFILTALSSLLERSGRQGLADDVAIMAAGSPDALVYLAAFMAGQGLEVVALFNSDDEGREQEALLRTKWLPQYAGTRTSTVLLGDALEQSGDVGIEDLLSERHYLKRVHESHSTALMRAGVKTVAPIGSGTLAARVASGFAAAGATFKREAVSKVIRKELQELRRMPFLSDIGRDTADKAARLFVFLNSRFSSDEQKPVTSTETSEAADPEERPPAANAA
jgi:energy-coupling factor transporter ATP-binding protein EcfA2